MLGKSFFGTCHLSLFDTRLKLCFLAYTNAFSPKAVALMRRQVKSQRKSNIAQQRHLLNLDLLGEHEEKLFTLELSGYMLFIISITFLSVLGVIRRSFLDEQNIWKSTNF